MGPERWWASYGGLFRLVAKQSLDRGEDTQGDVKPRLVVPGGETLNAFLRDRQGAVPVPFDEVLGCALNFGVCNYQTQAPILPLQVVRLLVATEP